MGFRRCKTSRLGKIRKIKIRIDTTPKVKAMLHIYLNEMGGMNQVNRLCNAIVQEKVTITKRQLIEEVKLRMLPLLPEEIREELNMDIVQGSANRVCGNEVASGECHGNANQSTDDATNGVNRGANGGVKDDVDDELVDK
ncbi:uncharacterized protein LOC115631868 [Scaptodrosophila lebanonensis]|uniref:Uncharacterized protein LOC115631868 n=1 Tax=Drosophila lebanonensis TaxID=7225 RepID=A0A6J2U9A2_DROLE|nr:uncharacterized protein LOC115631868 [Scaptodrosophila lebanonensis]